MRIGIDARLWNETGVGRYIRNLIINLLKIDKKNDYTLFVRSIDEKEINTLDLRLKTVITDIHWHTIGEQVKLPRILNEQNLDLMHFPYFSVPVFYSRPFIVTIHDLIMHRFGTGRASTLPYPLYFMKRLGYHIVLSNAVYRSKKIIVPSKAVRDDLLKAHVNINPFKIEVTYEGGLDQELKVKSEKLKVVEGQYILRVGNFYPHKNVEGLLQAFAGVVHLRGESAPASRMERNLKLVLVGKKDYFYNRIEKLVKKLSLDSNVVFKENVSDEELVYLYKHAVATIIPSFSEGFSLTAVEAMSQGCPVIASDIPIHREILKEAAIYCNPNSINDIKQKINFAFSLAQDSRKELIEQGKNRSKQFSWRTMTQKTLDIYNSILL